MNIHNITAQTIIAELRNMTSEDRAIIAGLNGMNQNAAMHLVTSDVYDYSYGINAMTSRSAPGFVAYATALHLQDARA